MLQMRSRVQPEGILKICNAAIKIGDRACKEGGCGIIIKTFGLIPADSGLRSRTIVQSVKIRNRELADSELKGLKGWDCEGSPGNADGIRNASRQPACPKRAHLHGNGTRRTAHLLTERCRAVDLQTF